MTFKSGDRVQVIAEADCYPNAKGKVVMDYHESNSFVFVEFEESALNWDTDFGLCATGFLTTELIKL